MANSQLTAYASAQLDKGVSREAITQALIGAGWMQADVDAALAEVMQQRAGTMNVAVTPGTSPTVVVSQTQPATATVAEPVTTTITATTTPATSTTAPATSSASPVTPASFFATTPSMATMDTAEVAPKRSLTWLFVLVGILLALGIIGGAAYAFLGGSAEAVVPGVTDQNEVATLQQERDQLRAEVSTLTQNMQVLENELSIFQATTSTSVPLTITGRLATTTTGAWTLTTPHDIVLTINNAREAAVATALTPLRDANVTLTGTHAPGSTLLRVTAINGLSVEATSTSTATTTPIGTR